MKTADEVAREIEDMAWPYRDRIAATIRADRIALLDEIEARCPRMLIETANALQDIRRELEQPK